MTKRKHIKIVEKKIPTNHVGFCYKGDNLIEIDPRQRPKKFLNTLIHELLHDCFPKMSERDINKVARVLADHLWDMGYRRIYQ